MNDTLVVLLSYLAQSLGSLGCAIITLSLGIRLALLPLTLKLARRARRNQELMRALQPEIEQLKKRFAKKPERLFEEMGNLYRKHNCRPFDLPTLVGGFIQFPIFAMLYSSIRNSLGSSSAFLWIKNLALPDIYLTLAVLFLTGLSACLLPSAPAQVRSTLIIIQLVVTFLIIWKIANGLSLYWVSSGVVSLLQTVWLRYRNPTGSRPA